MAAPPTRIKSTGGSLGGQSFGEESERPQDDIACERMHGSMVASARLGDVHVSGQELGECRLTHELQDHPLDPGLRSV